MDPKAQARVITHMLLDPRLQERVSRDPEAIAARFEFCPCGREILASMIDLRRTLQDQEKFTVVALTGVLLLERLLARVDHSGQGNR